MGCLLKTENLSYAKFISPVGTAWFETAIETTGYALEVEEYSTYIENLILYLYTGVVDFEIIEQTAEGSNVTSTSSFIQNGETWFVLGTFIQRDEVV